MLACSSRSPYFVTSTHAHLHPCPTAPAWLQREPARMPPPNTMTFRHVEALNLASRKQGKPGTRKCSMVSSWTLLHFQCLGNPPQAAHLFPRVRASMQPSWELANPDSFKCLQNQKEDPLPAKSPCSPRSPSSRFEEPSANNPAHPRPKAWPANQPCRTNARDVPTI